MTIDVIENDAYSLKHLKVDVEIGNNEVSGFKPQFKLKRWDGECSFDINFLQGILEEEEIEEEVDDEGRIEKIKYKVKYMNGEEIEYEFSQVEPFREGSVTQNELGGLEFGINLKKKPNSNILSFSINTHGLDWFFQPPLHPDHPTWLDEDGDGIPDNFRPENVVGSWVAHHSTKTSIHMSKAEADKYRCGIAFHIYRPEVIDAEGKRAWCDLDISGGEMTITMPQSFLDSSVYPILLDPNFGYETKGGTSYQYVYNGRTLKIDQPASGTLQSITCFIYAQNAGADWAMGLYGAIDGNDIAQRKDYTTEGGGTKNDWDTLAVIGGYSLNGEANSHILVFVNNVSPLTLGYYNSGGVDEMRGTASGSYSYPLSTSYDLWFDEDRKLSIYATYALPVVIPTVTTQDATGIGFDP